MPLVLNCDVATSSALRNVLPGRDGRSGQQHRCLFMFRSARHELSRLPQWRRDLATADLRLAAAHAAPAAREFRRVSCHEPGRASPPSGRHQTFPAARNLPLWSTACRRWRALGFDYFEPWSEYLPPRRGGGDAARGSRRRAEELSLQFSRLWWDRSRLRVQKLFCALACRHFVSLLFVYLPAKDFGLARTSRRSVVVL